MQSCLLKICSECMHERHLGTDFEAVLYENRFGFISFTVSGSNARQMFINEAGIHQWQRVPPTENRGRTHTSTVMVNVLDLQEAIKLNVSPNDVEVKTTKGSGPGGQNRNKVETCVVLTYRPLNIVIRCDSERSQYQNKQTAYEILNAKLNEHYARKSSTAYDVQRKKQFENSGSKIRSYMVKGDLVVDHRTNTRSSLKQWMKGK